mmetsp:Transcript_20265/g.63034  ORF Transcript_20265/g.63034 Transcript_20265/m.63034 type:complete len:361 (+) Transcript_20265:567-1649(+)
MAWRTGRKRSRGCGAWRTYRSTRATRPAAATAQALQPTHGAVATAVATTTPTTMGSPLSSRLCVELAARLGKVDDDLRRRELLAVRVGKATHALDVRAGTHLVDVTEGAAEKRREADAKDRANVAVRCTRDDAVLQAQERLVDETARHAVLHLLGGGRALRHGRAVLREQLDDLRVEVLAALDRAARPRAGGWRVVIEEARASLLAEDLVAHELVEEAEVGAGHAHAQIAGQIVHDVRGHVDAHLVGKRDGADGEAEGLHRLVERQRVGAALHERHGLCDHRAKAAVHVKARHVLDDDHGLALPDAYVDRRRARLLGRGGVRDHLEEGHLLDGREVVHADNALRVLGVLRDLAEREGGCV